MVPLCAGIAMLEFTGKHGSTDCPSSQTRSITDMLDPVLTESNPRVQSGTPMVTIILNIGTPNRTKKRKKSLSETVLEE